MARGYYHTDSSSEVSANALGVTVNQYVEGGKNYKDGVLIASTFSRGEGLGAPSPVAMQKFFGADKAVIRSAVSSDPADWAGSETEWNAGEPSEILSREQYSSRYGLWGTEFSDYVMQEDTILSFEEIVREGEEYVLSFSLDPVESTHYYGNQMITMGGLSACPAFEYVNVTLRYTEDWSITEMRISEKYTSSKGIIKAETTGETVADLTHHGDKQLLAAGGKGGLGNLHFKTSVNRAPRQCTPGEPGQYRAVRLELKVLADVGLLGMPNAGKSTFITAVSNARPKIADYPFTTLHPHLGVVRVGPEQSFVVADIPGLIEGASEGAGLGHLFLRHLSRTSLLLHIIDCAPLDPDTDSVAEARALVAELAKYDDELAKKTRWVVLNKIDLVPEDEREELIARFRAELGGDRPLFVMSAATREGCETLIKAIAQELDTKRREAQQIEEQRDDVRFAETHEVEL